MVGLMPDRKPDLVTTFYFHGICWNSYFDLSFNELDTVVSSVSFHVVGTI